MGSLLGIFNGVHRFFLDNSKDIPPQKASMSGNAHYNKLTEKHGALLFNRIADWQSKNDSDFYLTPYGGILSEEDVYGRIYCFKCCYYDMPLYHERYGVFQGGMHYMQSRLRYKGRNGEEIKKERRAFLTFMAAIAEDMYCTEQNPDEQAMYCEYGIGPKSTPHWIYGDEERLSNKFNETLALIALEENTRAEEIQGTLPQETSSSAEDTPSL